MPRYPADSAEPLVIVKDPHAVLDYVWDWKANTNGSDTSIDDWLQSGETISDRDVTVDTGLTLDSDSTTSGKVTVWLSGGTAGVTYTVAVKITTSLGRIDERSIRIRVLNR